jgi:hypothetical protein
MDGEKSDLPNLPPTLTGLVAEQLSLFGGVLASNHEALDRLNFRMLAASLEQSGTVLMQLDFVPIIHDYGPFALPYPQFEVTSQSTVLTHFGYRSAGIDDVAKAVINDTYPTSDPSILEYYRARDRDKLDSLSLESLERLAAAILAETRRVSPLVGGPDQIGVFPKSGPVRWRLPELPSSRQKRKSTIVNAGSSYSRHGFTPSEHAQMKGKNAVALLTVSLLQPFEEPFTQVYSAALFGTLQCS